MSVPLPSLTFPLRPVHPTIPFVRVRFPGHDSPAQLETGVSVIYPYCQYAQSKSTVCRPE